MISMILLILTGVSSLALACDLQFKSPTQIINEAELIVWARPDIATYVAPKTEDGELAELHGGILEFEPLETLKGDHPELLEVRNGLPRYDLLNNIETPMLLFLNKDENGYWSNHLISPDGTLSDNEYNSYRRLVLDYGAVRQLPEELRTHALIDLSLDLFDEGGDMFFSGLFMLDEAIDSESLEPWLKKPVWERNGKDPNVMTMDQRARLMDFVMKNPRNGAFFLELAWPMDHGADELLLQAIEQDDLFRPGLDVLDAFLLRHPAPIIRSLLQNIESLEDRLRVRLTSPDPNEEDEIIIARRDDLYLDIQTQMRCILEK